LKGIKWTKQLQNPAPKHIPNALATVMSYDGKLLVAITETCEKISRKNSLTTSLTPISNQNPTSLIKMVKFSGLGYQRLESFKDSLIRLVANESHVTDWFTHGGVGLKSDNRRVCTKWRGTRRHIDANCRDDSWVTWYHNTFTRQGTGEMQCPDKYFVSEILCHSSRDGYHILPEYKCAFRKLICRQIVNNAGIWIKNIFRTAEPNRDHNRATCDENYYLVGLRCTNIYCISFQLICREIEVCNLCALAYLSLSTILDPNHYYHH